VRKSGSPGDSAQTDDGDDVTSVVFAVAGSIFRSCSGQVSFLDLVVRGGRRECLRFTVSIGRCRTAFFTRRQTAVDAVAVRIIVNQKQSLLGTRRGDAGDIQESGEADQDCAHEFAGKRRVAAPISKMRSKSLIGA
jgi:hypothetical protein